MMKKMGVDRVIRAALVTVFAVLVAFSFNSCGDEAQLDPQYSCNITVKTLSDSTRVNNVRVELIAPVAGSQVYFEGYSNEEGEVLFDIDTHATLVVRASRGNAPNYTWIGCSEVRLQPNELMETTVYIEPYNPSLVGCIFE